MQVPDCFLNLITFLFKYAVAYCAFIKAVIGWLTWIIHSPETVLKFRKSHKWQSSQRRRRVSWADGAWYCELVLNFHCNADNQDPHLTIQVTNTFLFGNAQTFRWHIALSIRMNGCRWNNIIILGSVKGCGQNFKVKHSLWICLLCCKEVDSKLLHLSNSAVVLGYH